MFGWLIFLLCSLLLRKLKKKINDAECRQITKSLLKWPTEVLQLQAEISALKYRYVRVPQILVEEVILIS
jgi:hypothetical protein